MKKAAILLGAAALALTVGCANAPDKAMETLNNSTSETPAASADAPQDADASQDTDAEQDANAKQDAKSSGSGMPEYDFGMDEAAYLVETYSLPDDRYLDLVSYDQLVWIVQNKGTAAVVVAQPGEDASVRMVSEAKSAINGLGSTLYVYEPYRDAPDGDWSGVAQGLVDGGLANLEGFEPGLLMAIERSAKDSDGNPAPIVGQTDNPNEATTIISMVCGISCCTF
ncbi:Uncharacterised protein [Slackia heliotrinireducens]|uniref:Lipoprotein n=1 Tax=Slackia heliotrinireducens (strain ATCC 29202 / DSM 20476 / NCTC 11029 / RHS 1) TaxID=471855 RepID=C7N8F4_SLAHD|nr:hypothetical protein [Slackia heliotrinireducens]ACV23189.1 hypothetical protein Shel_21790 [Slackia heliotrinireducens DSM 20476]VEH02273.1 Uncharacterised protein [Slackia heliotrinireducens]